MIQAKAVLAAFAFMLCLIPHTTKAERLNEWVIEDEISPIDGRHAFRARYPNREMAFVVNCVAKTAVVGFVSDRFEGLSRSVLALMRFDQEPPIYRVWMVFRGQVLHDGDDAREFLKTFLSKAAFHIRIEGREISVPLDALHNRREGIRTACGL